MYVVVCMYMCNIRLYIYIIFMHYHMYMCNVSHAIRSSVGPLSRGHKCFKFMDVHTNMHTYKVNLF